MRKHTEKFFLLQVERCMLFLLKKVKRVNWEYFALGYQQMDTKTTRPIRIRKQEKKAAMIE